MANTDRAYGFVAKGPLLRINAYSKDSSMSTALFIGDLAIMANDGNVEPMVTTTTTGGCLGASVCYSAASTASTAANPIFISDHTQQLYMAQDDGATTPAQTDLGNMVDHVAGAGSTTTLLSGYEIGLGTLGVSTGRVQLLDFVSRPDNAEDAVNADWVCQLNVGEGLLTLAAGI